eukprot:gene4744-5368_t
MEIKTALSKAYEYEDTLLFVDETITCYSEMLYQDMIPDQEYAQVRRAGYSSRCKTSSSDHNKLEMERSSRNVMMEADCTQKPNAFHCWLLAQLQNSTTTADGCVCHLDTTFGMSVDLDQLNSSADLDSSDWSNKSVLEEENDAFNATVYESCLYSEKQFRAGQNEMLSASRNYYDLYSTSSSQSSFCEDIGCSSSSKSGSETGTYDLSANQGFNARKQEGLNDKLKDRPGSWSDSGYSFTKSESDYSCFSSLSYGDSVPQFYQDTGVCCEKFGQSIKDVHQTDFDKICDNFSHVFIEETSAIEENVNKNYSGIENENASDDDVFGGENYNSEEKKILRELVNNPENKYETTKALSDISRSVPSKRHRLTANKFKKGFKLLCKKISEPLKVSRKGEAEKKRSEPKMHASIGEETAKDITAYVKLPTERPMQRANSYSSLFGRKGSLFTHAGVNEHALNKASSMFSLEHDRSFVEYESVKSNLETNERSTDSGKITAAPERGITTTPDRGYLKNWRMEDNAHLLSSSQSAARDDSTKQANSKLYSSSEALTRVKSPLLNGISGHCSKDYVLAPLEMKLNEQKSARTRQVRKLSDMI